MSNNKHIIYFVFVFLLLAGHAFAQTAEQCYGQNESSGNYAAGKDNPMNYIGEYGMGVDDMFATGYCTKPSPSSMTALNGQTCPLTSYDACVKWRHNIDKGINGEKSGTQHWEDCTYTQSARDAAAKDGVVLVNNTSNYDQFLTSPSLQDAAFGVLLTKEEAQANQLYTQYFGSGQNTVVNGVTMTPDVISYLIHGSGFNGAKSYLDDPINNNLCDKVYTNVCRDTYTRKMSDCMNGLVPLNGSYTMSACGS